MGFIRATTVSRCVRDASRAKALCSVAWSEGGGGGEAEGTGGVGVRGGVQQGCTGARGFGRPYTVSMVHQTVVTNVTRASQSRLRSGIPR